MDTKAAFEKWFESREIEMKKNGLGLISIASAQGHYFRRRVAAKSSRHRQ